MELGLGANCIALRDHYCPGTTTGGIGDGEVSLVDGDGTDSGNDHLVDADVGGTGCSVDPWERRVPSLEVSIGQLK